MDIDFGGMISKALGPFSTGSFWGLTLAISVLMTTLAKSLRAATPNTLAAHPLFGFALTWTNILLGIMGALPSVFLTGGSFLERVPYGIVAGGLSHSAYQVVLRRFEFFSGPKDAPAPAGDPPGGAA